MRKKLRLLLLSALMMVTLSTFGQSVRGFYLQDVGDWLGNTIKENEILQYAQGNGFNYILFYDLGDINWNSSSEKNQLGAFIQKARAQYGIIQVGGVVEYAGYVSMNLIPYNNSRTHSSQKFDVINHEFEFWVTSSITSSYCSKFLSPGGFPCTKAGAWDFAWREFKIIDDLCAANGMMSEYYLGWPDLSQMQKLAGRADRLMISAYRPTDSDIYLYSKQRFKDIATIGGVTKVLTLLSSESSFMGPWLQNNPQTKPFTTLTNALAAETGSFKNNINLNGYQWFTYKYMPKTILATASITANGPTSFCPGGNVTLTANTGTAYLWSSGQITQSITVSSAGSYTVRVTSANGTNVTSAPTIVSTSGTGSTPVISATGSTSFCPGASVVLTSSPASSYLWSTGATTQSITVTTTGSYSVTTGGGSCSGTSAAVNVDASSAPSVPIITENGSLNVCPGALLTLTSTPASGYLWSTGATTRSIVVSAAGNYSVRAYSGPGCFATSTVKTVALLTAPATPIITASGSTTLSSTVPTVTLTSTSANTYNWTDGSTTRAITINTQGSYRVTITGLNGCQATSSDVVVKKNGCTPPAVPTISLSGSNILTSGQSVTLTSSLSGGYLWSTGATTRSITVTTPGIYTVRNYNMGYCYSTSLPVTVTVMLPRIANSGEINNNIIKLEFSLYPNPASENFNIVFHQTQEKQVNIKVLDLTGREVYSREVESTLGENRIQLDISELPRGLYLACLVIGDEKEVKKVIIE